MKNNKEIKDELYYKAIEEIIKDNKASATFLMRRLRIGYARSALIIDQLEENGVISCINGTKPREILI